MDENYRGLGELSRRWSRCPINKTVRLWLTLTTSLISRVRNHQVPSAKHSPHPHQPHPLVVSALLTMGWQWMSVLLVVGFCGPRSWLLGMRGRETDATVSRKEMSMPMPYSRRSDHHWGSMPTGKYVTFRHLYRCTRPTGPAHPILGSSFSYRNSLPNLHSSMILSHRV